MKTGLFFGSFNPVHAGHMIIGSYMAEFTDLSEIWMVASPQNPLKQHEILLPAEQRLHMINLAIGNYEKIKASEAELDLPQPSYTINTLSYLKKNYSSRTFVLLMGSDNIASFNKWKDCEKIIRNYEIYVYPRMLKHAPALMDHRNIKYMEAPLIEVSSTFIRNSIKENKDVRYMLPHSVHSYIKEENLYKN